VVDLPTHKQAMIKEAIILPADFSTGEPAIDDDQYIEFYENNPNMIHFDPPLTINEFLEKSLLPQDTQVFPLQ